MSREEALAALADLRTKKSRDCEHQHIVADEILCDLLRTLGYEDVVAEWEKIEKWYA